MSNSQRSGMELWSLESGNDSEDKARSDGGHQDIEEGFALVFIAQ